KGFRIRRHGPILTVSPEISVDVQHARLGLLVPSHVIAAILLDVPVADVSVVTELLGIAREADGHAPAVYPIRDEQIRRRREARSSCHLTISLRTALTGSA